MGGRRRSQDAVKTPTHAASVNVAYRFGTADTDSLQTPPDPTDSTRILTPSCRWDFTVDVSSILVSDHIQQRCHAESATLVHGDGSGGTDRFPPGQTRTAAEEPVVVPVQAGVHVHGSDHQPGQGESSTAAPLTALLLLLSHLYRNPDTLLLG